MVGHCGGRRWSRRWSRRWRQRFNGRLNCSWRGRTQRCCQKCRQPARLIDVIASDNLVTRNGAYVPVTPESLTPATTWLALAFRAKLGAIGAGAWLRLGARRTLLPGVLTRLCPGILSRVLSGLVPRLLPDVLALLGALVLGTTLLWPRLTFRPVMTFGTILAIIALITLGSFKTFRAFGAILAVLTFRAITIAALRRIAGLGNANGISVVGNIRLVHAGMHALGNAAMDRRILPEIVIAIAVFAVFKGAWQDAVGLLILGLGCSNQTEIMLRMLQQAFARNRIASDLRVAGQLRVLLSDVLGCTPDLHIGSIGLVAARQWIGPLAVRPSPHTPVLTWSHLSLM